MPQSATIAAVTLRAPLSRIFQTQAFGVNPGMYKQYGMIGHNGRDFRTVFNLPDFKTPKGQCHVYPMADGKIIEVGDQDIYKNGVRIKGVGYGKFVRIEHADGSQTIYAHLHVWYVKVGQSVTTNQIIAITDNTGASTGSHLHVGYRPPNWKMLYNNGFKGYTNFNIIPR